MNLPTDVEHVSTLTGNGLTIVIYRTHRKITHGPRQHWVTWEYNGQPGVIRTGSWHAAFVISLRMIRAYQHGVYQYEGGAA